MLKKYKILVDNTKEYREIPCETLYLAHDLSFISGVTSSENFIYGGSNGIPPQNLVLQFSEDGNFTEFRLRECKKVTRQGYIIYPKRYPIHKFKHFTKEGGKFTSSSTEMVDIHYFINDNGNYYFDNGDFKFDVDGKKIESLSNEVIECDTKIWVEDGYIQIDDVKTEVIFDTFAKSGLTGTWLEENVSISLNDDEYKIYQYQPEERYEVYKFIIIPNTNVKIIIDEANAASPHDYFYFSTNEMPISCCFSDLDDKKELRENAKRFLKPELIDGKWVDVYNYGVIHFEREYANNAPTYNIKCVSGSTELKDKLFPIHHEWNVDNHGFYVKLNTKSETLNLKPGTSIFVSNVNTGIVCEVNDVDDGNAPKNILDTPAYIYFSGKKYEVHGVDKNGFTKDAICKIDLHGKEYELIFDENIDASNSMNENYPLFAHTFIISEDIPTILNVKEDKSECVHYGVYNIAGDKSYEKHIINRYAWVEINGRKYILESFKDPDDETNYKYFVFVKEIESYELIVHEVIGSNELICYPLGENVESLPAIIHANLNSFSFFINVGIENYQNVHVEDFYENNYLSIINTLKVFNPNGYIPLTITFDNDMGINLQQEDTVTRDFSEREINARMNRIIDMEKDVYYPRKLTGDNKLKEISKLKFYLHFRDRSKDNVDDASDLVNEEWKSSENKEWNITEYYNKSNFAENSGMEYFQPSDLLFFMKFTDNDVYYQKSRIAKSFLRLSFYDTPNPYTQSLLSTSTVFVNEHELYLKYIGNTWHETWYGRNNKYGFRFNGDDEWYNEIEEKYEKSKWKIAEDIKVCAENVVAEDKKIITFDSDKRLSMDINIDNMHNTAESSEGFYIHLFKEFSTNLRPRTIYMKAEFSHAGIGDTLSMFCPMKDTGNLIYDVDSHYVESPQARTTKELYTYDEIINNYCMRKDNKLVKPEERMQYRTKGVGLKELFESTYIPINVVFDEETQQYVYYLDEGMNGGLEDDVMRFNLYELKLRDES